MLMFAAKVIVFPSLLVIGCFVALGVVTAVGSLAPDPLPVPKEK